MAMVEMVVYRVVFSQEGHALVLLSDLDEERLLPIWIGLPEATAIAMKLQDEVFERPLTHDLLASIIAELGYELPRLEITKLEDRIFYALIHLTNGDRHVTIDSRPSDAIALAVRTGARIYVAEPVLAEAQLFRHEFDEAAGIEKFKELMQPLSSVDLADGDDTAGRPPGSPGERTDETGMEDDEQ